MSISLYQGVDVWNKWRDRYPKTKPDLSGAELQKTNLIGAALQSANLGGAKLSGADLRAANLKSADLRAADLIGANLSRADLIEADLGWANLSETNLIEANLMGANLSVASLNWADLGWTNLSWANLVEANLGGANLIGANVIEANLDGANLDKAVLWNTTIADVNLSRADGLDGCKHRGPSIIDHRTLKRSGMLPLEFLRGCGLSNTMIEFLPGLINQPIQICSCFISYAGEDEEFAKRLYTDLQRQGIRCWFAPEDLRIGERFWDDIDKAVRVREKLVVVLSQAALESEWIEGEIATAFAEEHRWKQTVIFPIRIDDAVMESDESWAAKLRADRSIGDFTNWKNDDAYKTAFDHVLGDLKADLFKRIRDIEIEGIRVTS